MVLVPSGITVLWQLSQLIVVPAFKIDREAVTNRQYLQYLVQTREPIAERYWEIRGIFSKTIKPRDGDFDDPVKFVTWDDAVKYARWRGARLPRCVEWIRAVKGPLPGGWPAGEEADIDRYFEEFARTDLQGLADVFTRHAAPFDTGEHLNPTVTFARQWEWAIEPLLALRHIQDDRSLAATLEAQVDRARENNRSEDITLIYAHWERTKADAESRRMRVDWESSDERPLLGFKSDAGHRENGMIESLSRSLGGGKIGFRCVVDA